METKRWRPKLGEDYYRIGIFYDELELFKERNDGTIVDSQIFRSGNCYKTKADANKKLKLIKNILKQP